VNYLDTVNATYIPAYGYRKNPIRIKNDLNKQTDLSPKNMISLYFFNHDFL